jgi:hypothetical protein
LASTSKVTVKIRAYNKPILDEVTWGKRGDLRQALAKKLRPNINVMRFIGSQMVEGFKGGERATAMRVNPNGTFTHSTARYVFGILRGISPNGAPYKDLSKHTVAVKKRQGSLYADQPLRFRNYGNPMALVNSLTYRIYANKNGVELVFKDQEMNERSMFHEEGRKSTPSPLFTKGNSEKPVMVKVPARPHRDIQPQVADVVRRILLAWADKGSK